MIYSFIFQNKDSDLNHALVHFAKNNRRLVGTSKDVETHVVYARRWSADYQKTIYRGLKIDTWCCERVNLIFSVDSLMGSFFVYLTDSAIVNNNSYYLCVKVQLAVSSDNLQNFWAKIHSVLNHVSFFGFPTQTWTIM